MTTIAPAAMPAVEQPSAGETIRKETLQSAAVGAIAAGGTIGVLAALVGNGGAGSGSTLRYALPIAGLTAIVGGVAGAGAGAARGAVDAHTGTGIGPAALQTGAAAVAGTVAGVGALYALGRPLAAKVGVPEFLLGPIVAAAVGVGAATAVPPLLDKVGIGN